MRVVGKREREKQSRFGERADVRTLLLMSFLPKNCDPPTDGGPYIFRKFETF